MNSDLIYEKEYDTCNRFVLKSFASILVFIGVVYILNISGVFIVKQYAMNLITLVSVITGSTLAITYFAMKKKYYGMLYFAYIALSLVLIFVGVLYSFLTFHVIFLFLFPVLLFNVYGEKKLTIYATIGTLVVMILSHYASYYCGVNPEEPFKDLKSIMLFGLLPKVIIYFAFMYIFFFISDHNSKMIKEICTYSHDMYVTQEEMVRAFAEISESKSGQTGQHVKRVSRYVEVMATELGISQMEKESFVIASMMHDVGKLNIPSEILDKKGRLTDEEFAIVKKHTQYGYELLKNSPGRTMEIAKEIALNHHERWDGRGYNGLSGENIHQYSRIMAIADVFDALVSKRSYKDKWDPKDAYDEIVNQAGKQFDPELVKVFEKCYPRFLQILEEMPE